MLVAMKVRKPDNRQTHTKPLSVVVDSASQSAARLDAVESIADMLLRNGDWVACVRSEKCKPVRNKVHIDSEQIESDRFRIRFTSVEKTEPDVYLEVQHPCWSCNSNSSSANASAGVR